MGNTSQYGGVPYMYHLNKQFGMRFQTLFGILFMSAGQNCVGNKIEDTER